jgi:lactoylglutathione lyase
MIIEHIGIWTDDLERLKDYYTKYFDGIPNDKYYNPQTRFESYYLRFGSGSQLEIMTRPGIPDNANDTINLQHKGLIHLAFGFDTMEEVDQKCAQLKEAGFEILRGPRSAGDGSYEFETLDPDNNRIEVTTK